MTTKAKPPPAVDYLTPEDVSRFWISERIRQAMESTARRHANDGTAAKVVVVADAATVRKRGAS